MMSCQGGVLLKLKNKILLTIIVMTLVPLIIVVIYFNVGSERIINSKVGEYFEQLVNRNGAYMDLQINHLETSLNSIILNNVIKDNLKNYHEKTPIEKVDAWVKVNQVTKAPMALNKDINSVIYYIYSDDKIEVYGETQDEKNNSVYYSHFFRRYFEKNKEENQSTESHLERPVWFYEREELKERIFVKHELVDFTNGQPIGMVIFTLEMAMFRNIIEETKTDNGENVFLLNEQDKYMISDEEEMIGKPCTEPFMNQMNRQSGLLIEKGYLIAYRQMSNGYKLISRVPIKNLTKDLMDFRYISIVIAIACVVVAIGISILFSDYVGKKFKQLIHLMEQVQEGDFAISKEGIHHVKDEFSIIFKHFFHMVARLKQLINKTYVQEIEKKESELQALQYQINPHFLFNTLEIIHSMSKVYDCGDIGIVSNKLGEVFRYNMNREGKELISLEEEIKHIDNYLYIQNIHHNQSIQFFCDIQEDFYSYKILRFVMQPLIENCIKYGFKSRGGAGCIEMGAYHDDNNLYITVSDDGIGIDKERLEILKQSINVPKSKLWKQVGLGLRNVHQRLKLAFGEEYGLQLESSDKGTIVTVKLPFIAGNIKSDGV